MHTLGVAPPDGLRNSRAAKRRRKTQLVAARHEHTVTFVDVLKILVRLAVLARDEMQHLCVFHAELAKQLFVVSAGVLEFRGGRNNADTCILATADINKTVENFRIILSRISGLFSFSSAPPIGMI
jgi:hypothetical protein